jgi:hypothetical protein
VEEIAELNRADQDRLDRMPTQAERRVGLVLSGFLTLIFSCCAAFVLMRAQSAEANRGELVTFGGILAAIGLVGGFFFYRFAFTAPMTSSRPSCSRSSPTPRRPSGRSASIRSRATTGKTSSGRCRSMRRHRSCCALARNLSAWAAACGTGSTARTVVPMASGSASR